ncbi:hypothetical protein [Pseudomonas aeruginosa]|uniref:hypothetical protein n=1 Tax=Pseudomonas aeruginosa TaxID=287 RepID=UPI0024BDA7DE|nr:hypothetical protein [Pseudomonas aeruginosa]
MEVVVVEEGREGVEGKERMEGGRKYLVEMGREVGERMNGGDGLERKVGEEMEKGGG